MADSFEPDSFEPETPGPTPINSLPSASASMGPTRRRIASEGPGGIGQTIRAVGSALPFTDYGGGVGNWLQDRFPELLGGAPQGRERTWEEALSDVRADRARAAEAEPLAAAAGAVLGTKNLPWAKGPGVLKTLARAGQAAGLTGLTEATQGKSAEEVARSAGSAAGLTAGIEGALHLPGALRAVGGKLRGAASERAWRAGAFTPTQAEAAADALDPAGVSAKEIVGTFMRDAKLSDGTPVVGLGDDAAAVFGKFQRYLEEQGAAKGALVSKAEAQGAVVDSKAVMDQVKGLISELDTPEMRVAYPDIQGKLKAFAARMESEYGPKDPQLIGISQQGTGAAATPFPEDAGLIGGQSRLLPETTRPAPNSGWSPVFTEPPPPRTFAEWERLKTVLQSLVEDTKSGLNRSEAAIEASPALQKLRAFGSTIREADEAAARQALSPEDFQAFMQAKKNYGTAAEIHKPFKMAVHGEETNSPFNVSYEFRRAGRMLPYAGLAAGGGMGAATGNPLNVLLGAGLGAGAGKLAQVFEHANPTMTRAYDAAGRGLSGVQGPAVDVPDELAALLAYLRATSKKETP